MLNEKRIKLMTRMAMYEEGKGKEDFKISEYYQKDYASLNTWITVIWVTIGYAIIAGAVMLVFLDQIFDVGSLMAVFTIVGVVVVGWLMTILIMGIISYQFYKKKHIDARTRIKKFNHGLIRLGKMYEKERK